jgi:hypothetical protein
VGCAVKKKRGLFYAAFRSTASVKNNLNQTYKHLILLIKIQMRRIKYSAMNGAA